jgi:predicted nuclease of predicted toxin-antitoxin system
MTLLFDENLSFRLVEQLADVYPHSLHVRDVGLSGRSDEEIWRYAVRKNCAIMTKDVDFYQRSMLRGAPPKVIWVRIGNATTRSIADVLRSRFPSVQHFIAESDTAFLELAPHD